MRWVRIFEKKAAVLLLTLMVFTSVGCAGQNVGRENSDISIGSAKQDAVRDTPDVSSGSAQGNDQEASDVSSGSAQGNDQEASDVSSGSALDNSQKASNTEQSTDDMQDESSASSEEEEMREMIIKVGDEELHVNWENNESVEALRALCEEEPLEIQMSMYGGFEQVGSIGQSLPRGDAQMTTSAGDIVLYAGNQIVMFYGSNSWAYTRLGHIRDKSGAELTELLGSGDVSITVSVG